jgi:hypothetical protein
MVATQLNVATEDAATLIFSDTSKKGTQEMNKKVGNLLTMHK